MSGNEPLRITFVLPRVGFSGGVRVVAQYADLLSRRGHAVVTVSVPPRRPTWRERFQSLARGHGWAAYKRRPASHLDGAKVDHCVLDRHRPVTEADVPDADVIVATWWETAEWISRMSAAKGAKVFLIQHDERQLSPHRERVTAAWSLPMTKIVVAPWLAKLIEAEHGSRVTVIPNCIDTTRFYAPPRGKARVPTVGTMLSNLSWKGSDIALEAVRLAQRRLPDLRLLAFGAINLRRVRHKTRGIAQLSYQRLPAPEQMRAIYSGCDAWLFASRSEGFGLPILEAMACRTPVIATPAGIAPASVPRGGGILVPHEDPTAMASAIVDVADMNETQWRRRSDAAYTLATGHTWDDAVVAFERVLRQAVAMQDHSNSIRGKSSPADGEVSFAWGSETVERS